MTVTVYAHSPKQSSKAGDAGPDVDVGIVAGTSEKRVDLHEGLVLDRDLVALPVGI